MGTAMIMVIVYHLFCWVYNPIGPFNIGYVGVDIFLFLSGFGLSYSFKKNSIAQFYINRIKRIYILYLISVLVTYLIYNLNWNLFDLFANILSIGIYTKGGINRYDWYLETLFSLYITFPILYYYGKTKIGGAIILWAVITFLLHNYNIPWWYDCFLGRLPIFFYGIIFSKCTDSWKTTCYVGVLLYYPNRLFVSSFLASSGLALPIITFLLYYLPLLPNKLKYLISFIGKHSLEFYIANLFVFWSFEGTSYTTIERFFLYILIQSIATTLSIKTNMIIRYYINPK